MITGFLVAKERLPNFFSPTATAAIRKSSRAQQNLALFHFRRLKTPAPELVSAWIVFLNTQTPSMNFVSIFHPDDSQTDGAPLAGLQVLPDGSLPPEFLHDLSSRYNVPIDGYIALDDVALVTFASQLPPAAAPLDPPQSPDHGLLLDLCQYLKSPPPDPEPAIPWGELIPNHFSSDTEFTILAGGWSHLRQAGSPPLCEVN